MPESLRKPAIACLATAIAGVCLRWCWMAWAPTVSTPPGLPTVELSRLEHPEVTLGDRIELPVGRGTYLRIDLGSGADDGSDVAPRTIELRRPVVLALYPRWDLMRDRQLIHCVLVEPEPKPRIRVDRGRDTDRVVPIGGRPEWKSQFGYSGAPEIQPRDGAESYWTFLVAPEAGQSAGESVFEVWVYPEAHWISQIRADLGEPVVLRRGVIAFGADE